MRKLASVERITNIVPIQNADRIELATILGWNVIVEKGKYRIGDLVVYVEYDTVLPVKKEFEFLRPRTYNSLYDGFRIRAIKLKNVFSEGIVFPLDIISTDYNKFHEGKEVTSFEPFKGIQRYAPEELKELKQTIKKHGKVYKYFMRYAIIRKFFLKKKIKYSYPDTIVKSDEKNIQVIFNNLKNQNLSYYKSEKLEGQSASFFVNKKGKFFVYSHNIGLKEKNNNWWKIAEKYNIEENIKKYKKIYKIKGLAIQGEIIGPGIQKNIYKRTELEFYIFNIRNTDLKMDFSLNAMKEFSKITGLKLVPVLEENAKLLDTVEEVLQEANGKSVLYDVKREGIVWRSMEPNPKISFKAKSKEYHLWWDKKS